ncbi:MAG: hypothetical protein Q9187_008924, partial [Circinaria calcarea]
ASRIAAPLHLRVLLMDTRDRSASNLHDKVFSLRGIASNILASGITVDYDKPVERVYTDYAKYQLKIRPDLRVLSAVEAQHRTVSTLRLPSWVPDWTQHNSVGGVLNRYYRFAPTKLFRAASASKPRLTIDGRSDIICLEGMRLDTVTSLIRVKSLLTTKSSNSFSLMETQLREIAANIMSLKTYPFTGETAWKAFFRTMTADRTALSPRIDETYRAKYLATFGNWNLDDDELGYSFPATAWTGVLESISTMINNMHMFLTEQGYLGIGHRGFQVGDVVCIFSGGEVPFLLQPELCRDGTWKFHSECYVHGVMDGEAMLNLEEHRLEKFWIK